MKQKLIAFTLAAVLAVLSGCGAKAPETTPSGDASQAPAASGEKVLNIFTWATYFPDDILAEFNQQTGIKINYTNFDSNEEMLMKLQAGGEYDLVLASDYIIDTARQEGLLLKLDKSKIPNFANINAAFQGNYYDPQNEYTVPYSAGVPLIVYNPAMTGVEVKGFADLWNPEFKDSVVVMDDMRNVIGLTLKQMGKSLNETDPAVLEQAKAKLMELKPNIRSLDYNTPYNLMISGETAVGYMFTSQVITALNENPDLKVVYPEEGFGFGIDSCFIPAKAPHADNAHAFLDFILDAKRSAHITDQIFYISCNTAAKPYLSDQRLTIPDDAAKNGEFIKNVGEAEQTYNDIWMEFKQA